MKLTNLKPLSKKCVTISLTLLLLTVFSAVIIFNASGLANQDPAGFSGGSGTQDDPYIISTVADLENLKAYIEDVDDNAGSGEFFKLNNDIDMSEKYGENSESWHYIGTSAKKFAGTLDGNNFAIISLSKKLL